jgi:hypothetical protein
MNHLSTTTTLFFHLLLLMPLISSTEIPFHACSQVSDTHYKVDQIDVDVTMNGYEFFLYGIPDSTIFCGHLDLKVSRLSQDLFSQEFDLCEFTTCPLLANQPSEITGSVNQSLPSGTYSVVINMVRDCNNCQTQCDLACVQFDYTVS